MSSFTPISFTRLNASTLKILDSTLLGKKLTVRAYGPAPNVYSPIKLYNYVSNTVMLDNIILWDPARKIYHPDASQVVDIQGTVNPAYYNARLDGGNRYNDANRAWGAAEVGTVWWYTSLLDYKPYYDDKLTPNVYDRLALWGALADYSAVNLYEWIQSPVAPADYIGSALNLADNSEPAIVNTLQRTRTWFIRPIAWRYGATSTTRTFLAASPATLYLTSSAPGSSQVILASGRLSTYGLTVGSKFSAALCSAPTKADSTVTSVSGLALATSTEQFVVGSSTSYVTPTIPASSLFTSLSVSVYDLSTFSNNSLNGGVITFGNVTDANGQVWIIATCVSSGISSRVQVLATSTTTGAQVSYKFQELGIMISGQAAAGTSALTTSQLSSVFGNTAIDVCVRSALSVNVLTAFIDPTTGNAVNELLAANASPLTNTGTSVDVGWVGWNDPQSLASDYYAPYNQWEPLLGSWIDATPGLSLLGSLITLDETSPFTTRAGVIYNQFQDTWSEWSPITNQVAIQRYYVIPGQDQVSNPYYFDGTTQFNGNEIYSGVKAVSGISNLFWPNYFTIDAAHLSQQSEARVYVNGTLLDAGAWSIPPGFNCIVVNNVNLGDKVVLVVPGYQPTSAELAYDPTAAGADPLVMTQYQVDYPHTVEPVRTVLGTESGANNYYFWVKGKCSPANANKSMSINAATSLLSMNTDPYAVTSVLKYFNQADSRPNRYGMLTVCGLDPYVRMSSAYKLRVTTNEALRNTDNNMTLKNKHDEWQLLRQKQTSLIPKQLWDLLTDTVCGQNAVGQAVPSVLYSSYDARNGTSTRYGFETGQIMCDSDTAVATIIYTIQNTTVMQYDSSYNAVPDYISYAGFEMSQLSSYFATPTSAREFMGALWVNADPRQVNEIFFAVLQDALVANTETTDFFKTSMISMQEVQIVQGS